MIKGETVLKRTGKCEGSPDKCVGRCVESDCSRRDNIASTMKITMNTKKGNGNDAFDKKKVFSTTKLH